MTRSRWRTMETVTLSRVALGGRIPAVYDQRYNCHNSRDGGLRLPATMFTTPRLLQRQQQAYKLRIAISAYPTCIWHPRRNIAIPFGTEKLEWCGCPMVKKFRRYFYSFWHNSRTWQTHKHTHTDTAWRHRPRLCMASRGKNQRYRNLHSLNKLHRFTDELNPLIFSVHTK